jgi:hypothetical protein
MELQTFLLATKVTRVSDSRYDVEQAALHHLEFPPESSFPVRFSLPALIVLRREIAAAETPFSLLFDIVDEDGRSVGEPHRLRAQGVFPPGPRFFSWPTLIAFVFPRPGRYRLDITADRGLTGAVYSYDIEITQREGS